MCHTVAGHFPSSPLASILDQTNESPPNDGFNKKQCDDVASCVNDEGSVTLKQTPPQSPLPANYTNVIMADIPLRHSSHTRTLLPGLRRKSSILRHSTPRSRWQTVTEQIQRHRSFSFLFSTCITRSSTPGKNGARPDMTGSPPIIIKPPQHTQRILKYDPITGNAYNNNNDKSHGCRIPCPSIAITAFGRIIPRNKALLSIWKMTFLLSFVYINLHLLHLQQEHHLLFDAVFSSLSNSELPYSHPQPQQHHRHHHRSLRGSVATTTTTTTSYNVNHEYFYHHYNHSVSNKNRATATTTNAPASKQQIRTVVPRDETIPDDLGDDDTATDHHHDDGDDDDDDSMGERFMDSLAMATAMQ